MLDKKNCGYEPTISVNAAEAISYGLKQLGAEASIREMSDFYGISEQFFSSEFNRIPLDIILDYAHVQAMRLNDPLIGIRIAKVVNLRKLRGSTNLFYVAQNVKQAFELFSRYSAVFSSASEVSLEREGNDCRLLVNPNSGNPHMRYFIEGSLMSLCKYMKGLGVNVLKSLHFSHDCPQDCHSQYEMEFGMPVTFGNDRTWFEVDAESLSLPLDTCRDPSFQFFEEAEKLLENSNCSLSLEEQVGFILNQLMPTRQVSAERMAEALGMNVRTFQRRLKKKDITYKDLLESARRSLAIEYLLYGGTTISEVANLLGYTDTSNFYRAFKNWTGMRPGEFRDNYREAM